MKKVILAYSGGLDTSIILKWLIEKGLEVVCFLADVGQKEDMALLKEKAFKIGASRVYIEDLRQEFVEKYVFQALKANAAYEGRYLLGTSLARPLIAKKQIEIARKEQCSVVAHGATGKGNDQVRFEIAYLTLMPEITILSPWKDPEFLNLFKGRPDMIKYAEAQGIPITSTLENLIAWMKIFFIQAMKEEFWKTLFMRLLKICFNRQHQLKQHQIKKLKS